MAAANPAMHVAANPYRAPAAAVADREQTQPVKLFSISGRIGRARYLAYGMGLYVAFWAVLFALGFIAARLGMQTTGEKGETLVGAITIVVWVPLLVLSIMLSIQRAHDFNARGWLAVLMFIPLVNLIFLLIPGTEGPNRFGPPTPKNTLGVILVAWVFPAIMILGILAAIALPAYQDYAKRAAAVQKR